MLQKNSNYCGLLMIGLICLFVGDFQLMAQEDKKQSESSSLDGDPESNDDTNGGDEKPYLCPQHWQTDRIFDFLITSDEKPRTIRRRDAFVEAVEDAAKRICSDTDASNTHRRIALLTAAESLHYHATWGNQKSDTRLEYFVNELAKREDKRSQSAVAFYQLEKKFLEFASDNEDDAEDINRLEKIKLLDEAFEFCKSRELGDQHLRLASNIVRVTNLIDSEDPKDEAERKKAFAIREEQFVRFGKLFAESSELKLSRYGKQIAEPKDDAGKFVGQPMELTGDDLNDNSINIAQFKGEVVIVDFWATWCGPCIAGLPKLVEVYDELGDQGLNVIGVSLDEDLEDLREFVEERGIAWPNLVGDSAKALAKKYNVRGIPTMFLVDTEGNVVAIGNGVEEFKPKITELLSKPEK